MVIPGLLFILVFLLLISVSRSLGVISWEKQKGSSRGGVPVSMSLFFSLQWATQRDFGKLE